jgi:protein gp37
MSGDSKIGWTGKTWNPTTGCSIASPGCDHCYAARDALEGRFLKEHPLYKGLAVMGESGHAEFTGEIRFDPKRFAQPLRWQQPTMIFVNSMSDLFHPNALKLTHEGVPVLAHIVATMVAAERHTFQVLTKRPAVMAAVLRSARFKLDVNALLLGMGHEVMPDGTSEGDTLWPAHIWWGTTIESTEYVWRADKLRDVPAPIRFVSAEPLIGPIAADIDLTGISWVIAGTESGRDSRRMELAWARDLLDATHAAGAAFFLKQIASLGGYRPITDPSDFPPELRVQEFPMVVAA